MATAFRKNALGGVQSPYAGSAPRNAFTPASIPSLIAWYGADQQRSYTDSAATTAALVGELIYSASDATGNLPVMQQSTATKQPMTGCDTDWYYQFGYGTYWQASYNSKYDFDSTQPFTIECYLRPNFGSESFNQPCVLDHADYSIGSGRGYSIRFKQVGGLYKIWILLMSGPGSTVRIEVTGSTTILNTQYYHIAVVYNGNQKLSGLTVYINGVAETLTQVANAISTPMSVNTVGLYIGTTSNAALQCPCRLRFVRIYNTALNSTQVSNLYSYSLIQRLALPIYETLPAIGTPFILDTDYGTDVDDAYDLSLCVRLHLAGVINLQAVISTTSIDTAPGAIQGALNYHGLYLTPTTIGANASLSMSVTDGYATTVRNHFGISTTRASYPTAVSIYRTVLAAAAPGSVVISNVGFGDNLQALLQSGADGISALTGIQLIQQSVKCLYWSAGVYPSGSEYNFTTSRVAGSYVCANWPNTVPIIFHDYNCGNTPSNSALVSGFLLSTDPLRVAGWNGRPSWGPQTDLEAAGFGYLYAYQGQNGTNTVNSSTGVNSWASTPNNNQSYRTKSVVDNTIKRILNRYMLTGLTSTNATSSLDFTQASNSAYVVLL